MKPQKKNAMQKVKLKSNIGVIKEFTKEHASILLEKYRTWTLVSEPEKPKTKRK